MTPKERVLKALRFEEPDRVPLVEQGISSEVASRILGRYAYTGGGTLWRDTTELLMRGERDLLAQRMARDIIDLVRATGLDLLRVPLVPPQGARSEAKKVDENTYLFGDPEGDYVVRRYDPISKMFSVVDNSAWREGVKAVRRAVERLNPDEVGPPHPSTFEAVETYKKELGDEYALLVSGAGIGIPLEPHWLEALVEAPELVERWLDWQMAKAKKELEAFAQRGVQIVFGGGDLAGRHGPVYSPRHFRELVLPRLQEIARTAKELGLTYVFRTDGNIWPIADMLLKESGIQGYGEIDQSAGMDLGEVRERFPHLVLWGGVDCARTLVYGSEEEVRREVREALEKAGQGGGLLLGSSNTIHPNVKVENFLAMVDEAKRMGRYGT